MSFLYRPPRSGSWGRRFSSRQSGATWAALPRLMPTTPLRWASVRRRT